MSPIESAVDPLSPVESVGVVLHVATQAIPRIVVRVVRSGPQMPVIVIGIFVTALVLGLTVGPRTMKVFAESKVDIAKLTVRKFVYEAYPSWSAGHPGRGWPASLHELTPYMDKRDVRDPWAATYELTCSERGPIVHSVGEDGKADTADDIWSNEDERR
jgi:hypothetical protein